MNHLPVPLLLFPDVINRRVLLTMTPCEIFLLSLCSEEMKRTLKKNMYKVDEVRIEFLNSSGERRITFSIRVKKQCLAVLLLGEMPIEEEGLREEKWGMRTRFEFLNDTVLFYSLPHQQPHQIRQIHAHLCDLFNCDPLAMFVKFDFWFDFRLLHPDSVTKTILADNSRALLGYDDINGFFRSQKSVRIAVLEREFKETAVMRVEHEVLKVPNLIIRHVKYNIPIVLAGFRGEHGLFENVYLLDTFVRGFLEHWSRGGKENLKTLIAYHQGRRRFDPRGVVEALKSGGLDGLTVENWDTEKRERFYPYQSIISEYHTFAPDTFDCKDGTDVVRDADGKRATIKISPKHFMFFVWS